MPQIRIPLPAIIFSLFNTPSFVLGGMPLDMAASWLDRPAARPIIDRGPAGARARFAVDNPFLWLEAGRLYCFYEGQEKPLHDGAHERVGPAVSDDGVRWGKCEANPILEVGRPDAWDSEMAKIPCLLKHADRYWLFDTGRAVGGKTMHIGLAVSTELRDWKKVPHPILRNHPDRWDRVLSTYPAPVFRSGSRFILLYRGMRRRYAAQGAGIPASTDLQHWQRLNAGPVIKPQNEIYSLAVGPAGGRFVAVAQSPQRHYWLSPDLIRWRSGPEARFCAPEVETVFNPLFFGGRWIVLYEQRDRI